MANVSAQKIGPMMICTRCGKALQVSNFRKRSKGSDLRMRQCRNCHATYERQRRQSHRLDAAGLFVQKTATVVARAPNLERVATLLDFMMSGLGGPEKFYQFWLEEIERLKSKRRPTFRLFRFYEMLANAEFQHAEAVARQRRLNAETSRRRTVSQY